MPQPHASRLVPGDHPVLGRPDPDRFSVAPFADACRRQRMKTYALAWMAWPDEDVVRGWLTECWTAQSWYVNPFCDPICGIDALMELIGDYQYLFPGSRMRLVRPALLHGRYGHMTWQLTSRLPIRVGGRDFGRRLGVHEVISFTTDHMIRSVVAVFDDPCG